MYKQTFNTKGFGLVGVLAGVLVLAVIVGGGVVVYHNNHKTKKAVSTSTATHMATKTATATPNPYAGWKNYDLSTAHLNVKYPATWTAASGAAQCDGSQLYTFKPPVSELSGISTSSINETLTSYEVGFTLEPTSSNDDTNCAPSSTLQGVQAGSQGASQVITSGVLKGKYFLITGSAASGTSNEFVLNNNYDSNQTIDESGLLSINGGSLSIGASFMAGQDIGDAGIVSYQSSQLYKDTVAILNSLTTN